MFDPIRRFATLHIKKTASVETGANFYLFPRVSSKERWDEIMAMEDVRLVRVDPGWSAVSSLPIDVAAKNRHSRWDLTSLGGFANFETDENFRRRVMAQEEVLQGVADREDESGE